MKSNTDVWFSATHKSQQTTFENKELNGKHCHNNINALL